MYLSNLSLSLQSTSLSGSERKGSTLRKLLRMSSMTQESSQLSLCISESKFEANAVTDKKPLDPIPEGREDIEASVTSVMSNPKTSDEDSSGEDEYNKEEITKM